MSFKRKMPDPPVNALTTLRLCVRCAGGPAANCRSAFAVLQQAGLKSSAVDWNAKVTSCDRWLDHTADPVNFFSYHMVGCCSPPHQHCHCQCCGSPTARAAAAPATAAVAACTAGCCFLRQSALQSAHCVTL